MTVPGSNPTSNRIGRRALLAGLATAPVAAGAAEFVSFQSRADVTSAEIPAEQSYISVRGLEFVADPAGTALTTADGRTWSPNGAITPLHFGEKSEDDTALIQAAVDHAAELGRTADWDANYDRPFPMQVIISGLNELYHVSAPIKLNGLNRSNVIRDFSIKAIPGVWEQNGGTGTVGDQDYHPAKSDYIFQSKAKATYLLFDNLKLNCNDQCGGILARSHTRVVNCFIKKCAGVGVMASAGDVWVDRCTIKQFDQNDVEYYVPANFTGIGVMCEDSDLRLTHSVVNWLAECVRIEGTNCNVAHCHIFNGCRGYLGSYTKRKGDFETRDPALNTALSAYLGRTIDDSYDFPPRPYHAGIVVNGPESIDNSFDSIYFDNCHMEIYAHGVHFNEPKLGSKPNSSLWASPIDYWFAVYPQREGDYPRFVIDEVNIFVESRAKRLVDFKAHPATGHGWAEGLADHNRSSHNFGASEWGDRYRLDVPMVHIVNQGPGRGKPAVTYASPALGSFVGFADTGSDHSQSFGDPGTPLEAWQSGQKYKIGMRCLNDGKVYENVSQKGGKSGRSAPVHDQGLQSDGKLDWFFVGTRDTVPVLFGGHGNNARISAPNGQLVIGAADNPRFRGDTANAVAIRTGNSGIQTPPPPGSDDLTLETGGNGGLSIGIPNGAKAAVTVSTPSDPARFQIEFDDATGRINFLVGGTVKHSVG